MLVIVDMQVDFVHPDGTLSVPGAAEDVQRLTSWIYDHAGEITAISASLDSHVPMQIFYPAWWRNPRTGRNPDPFTVITLEDIQGGVWQPVIDPKWSINYVGQLEQKAKKNLMIWPYHTMIGTAGHMLVPALYEAIVYHTSARLAQPMFLTKGTIPQVEHYGIMEPEVKYPNHPQGGTNTDFLDILGRYDLIYVAGEAKSHCVLETMRQILKYFDGQPNVISKIRFLTDCTSSVAHPQIDFDAMAEAELALMAKQGVVMTTTREPIT
jgi:nicotinamidase/pyrazinamidase